MSGPSNTPIEVRIERKIDRSAGPDACHIWLGGFGQFGLPHAYVGNDRSVSTRRWIWEQKHGPIPPKRWVTSTCGEKRCVNVKHLALRAHHDDEARFWENVAKGEGCWEWTGHTCKQRRDYGMFKLRGNRPVQAHRWIYEYINGPIDDPMMFVCHHCDNTKCVRPDHLFLGTPKDNSQDMIKKGRAAWQRNPRATSAKNTEEP